MYLLISKEIKLNSYMILIFLDESQNELLLNKTSLNLINTLMNHSVTYAVSYLNRTVQPRMVFKNSINNLTVKDLNLIEAPNLTKEEISKLQFSSKQYLEFL